MMLCSSYELGIIGGFDGWSGQMWAPIGLEELNFALRLDKLFFLLAMRISQQQPLLC